MRLFLPQHSALRCDIHGRDNQLAIILELVVVDSRRRVQLPAQRAQRARPGQPSPASSWRLFQVWAFG
jgi:hypothetical protein